MKSTAFVAALAFLIGSASGHTIFQKVHVNGVDQGQLVGLRTPTINGPITDVNSNDLICNGGPNPIVQYSDVVIPVQAGAQITAEWHHTLTSAELAGIDPDEPIAKSHKGPTITYLARVPDATTRDVLGLQWFKIFEDGLDSSGQWGVDRMIDNAGKVTFTLPSCIPSGQYLLRHEIIALHSAYAPSGAQFYMECAQLNVTGDGNASPATVSIPGLYSSNDHSILRYIMLLISGNRSTGLQLLKAKSRSCLLYE